MLILFMLIIIMLYKTCSNNKNKTLSKYNMSKKDWDAFDEKLGIKTK